jgi:hypothetical protein
MKGDAKCPACLSPLPPSPGRGRPRIWCSVSCRNWVAMIGGPSRAAELKEAWAKSHQSAAEAFGVGSRHAAELREEAARLRALGEGSP